MERNGLHRGMLGGTINLFIVMEMVYILTVMMLTQLYTIVKTQTINMK